MTCEELRGIICSATIEFLASNKLEYSTEDELSERICTFLKQFLSNARTVEIAPSSNVNLHLG